MSNIFVGHYYITKKMQCLLVILPEKKTVIFEVDLNYIPELNIVSTNAIQIGGFTSYIKRTL